MSWNKDLSISRQALPQSTPEPPPPPKSSSAGSNKNSISSFMENEHLNQGLHGGFANTQNPAAKFTLHGQNKLLSSPSPVPYEKQQTVSDDDTLASTTIRSDTLPYDDRPRIPASAQQTNRTLLHGRSNQTPASSRLPAQRSLASRTVINPQPKKNTWPKLKTVTGVLAGGAAGAATGAVAAGGVAGVTALGAAVTGGLIGAAAGSTVPIVGTVIGAAIGVVFGIAWGIRAKARQADMLDTKSRSWARTFQRSPVFAWARALDPMKLLRGIRRKIPLISGRRAAAVRVATQFRNCCQPIDATRKMKWEERGQDASVDEARGALRYAAAAQMSYLHGTNFDRRDVGSSENYENFATRKYMNWVNGSPGKAKDRYLPRYRDMKAPYADSGMTHGPGQGWHFQPISPQSSRLGRDIFNKLPASLRDSLDVDGSFHDKDTGNRIMLHYDSVNNEVVMAFSGTGSDQKWTALNQDLGNAANFLGGVPPSLEQAVAVGKAVRGAVAQYNSEHSGQPPINVVSTGHSRGGLQASVEAIKNGGKAITFNPEAMGGGVRAYCNLLTSDRVPPGTEITNFSTKNDFVSGSGFWSGVGNAWETVTGLPAPYIPGERKVLKRAPGAMGRHPDPIFHVAYRAGGGDPPTRRFPPAPPRQIPPPPNLVRA